MPKPKRASKRQHCCPYNTGLNCLLKSLTKCDSCGWNPKVSRHRAKYQPIEIDEEQALIGLAEICRRNEKKS